MNIINKFTDPNKSSILNLLLPYLGIICIDQLLSPLSSLLNSLIIISIIILAEILYTNVLSPINEKIRINASMNAIIIVIFYGEIIIEKTKKIIEVFNNSIQLNHWILIILSGVVIGVFYFWIFKYRRELNRIIKTFFIIFSLVMVAYKINQNKDFFFIKNNSVVFEKDSLSRENTKPTILIITDGYVSPDEIFKYTKNGFAYSLSDSLKHNYWNVNNNFHSEETTTMHSLSSLFNFNLKIENKKRVSSTYWGQKIYHSSLYDSLIKKGVKVYNYGIVDFGETNRFTNLYYYFPTTITGQFFDKSMINVKYIYNDSNLVDKQNFHNKFILDSVPEILANNERKKSFYYVHLLMPHDPYEYFNEFNTNSKINPNKYIDYWKFTNAKLFVLLKELIKDNKYKIIITGDHGYGDIGGGIRAENTFGAFYGFNEYEINKIKSVQDLGNLINASFN